MAGSRRDYISSGAPRRRQGEQLALTNQRCIAIGAAPRDNRKGEVDKRDDDAFIIYDSNSGTRERLRGWLWRQLWRTARPHGAPAYGDVESIFVVRSGMGDPNYDCGSARHALFRCGERNAGGLGSSKRRSRLPKRYSSMEEPN